MSLLAKSRLVIAPLSLMSVVMSAVMSAVMSVVMAAR
jgi:hypothetical protein